MDHRVLKALRERHNLIRRTGEATVHLGDGVLIKEEERNRRRWKFGIVEELIKGRDGVVRGARLRAGKSYLERPVQHLYPLELSCDRPVEERGVTLSAQAPEFQPRRAAAVARQRIAATAQEESQEDWTFEIEPWTRHWFIFHISLNQICKIDICNYVILSLRLSERHRRERKRLGNLCHRNSIKANVWKTISRVIIYRKLVYDKSSERFGAEKHFFECICQWLWRRWPQSAHWLRSDDSRTASESQWNRTCHSDCLLMHCHKSITDTLNTVKIAMRLSCAEEQRKSHSWKSEWSQKAHRGTTVFPLLVVYCSSFLHIK